MQKQLNQGFYNIVLCATVFIFDRKVEHSIPNPEGHFLPGPCLRNGIERKKFSAKNGAVTFGKIDILANKLFLQTQSRWQKLTRRSLVEGDEQQDRPNRWSCFASPHTNEIPSCDIKSFKRCLVIAIEPFSRRRSALC